MSTAQQLHDELIAAEAFEALRITGYLEILSFPANLLSADTRAEVNEALQWSSARIAHIQQATATVKTLIEHGYPDRVQQIAPAVAIEELKDRLSIMGLAVAEFETPPTVDVIVSDEIPAN